MAIFDHFSGIETLDAVQTEKQNHIMLYLSSYEKLIADRKTFAPMQFIVLDIGRDDPEEYERKLQRIAEIEASGGSRNGEPNLIVYSVIF